MQGSRLCFLILPTSIYNVFICSFLLYIQLTQLWYNQSVHKKDSSKWKIISVLTNLADIIYRTAQDNVRVPCTREFAYEASQNVDWESFLTFFSASAGERSKLQQQHLGKEKIRTTASFNILKILSSDS